MSNGKLAAVEWPARGRDPPGFAPLRAHELDDPRAADLPEDTAAWRALLKLSCDEPQGGPADLVGTLHGMRAMGACLVIRGGRYRIESRYFDDDLASWTPVTWAADRQAYLVPHTAAIKRLLAVLPLVLGDEQF